MALQHLRSSTANKRPLPAGMGDGQLAINTNLASPGLFLKNSNGDLVKVGPVHVGTTAPNVSPAAGGETGNTTGELWLDTSLTPNELKTWSGSAWVSATGQEIPVAKLADGSARQLLQTDAAGTGVEWTSNVDVPGTLDVTGAATFDSSVAVTGTLTKSGSNVVTVGDTGTVTSTMLLDGTIVNADVNASAAIAGTKISPDFGSQTVTTTGVFSADDGTAAAPGITFTGDTNTGIYSPGADQVAISTNGTGQLFVDAGGNVGLNTSSPAARLHVVATDGTIYQQATRGTGTTWRLQTSGANGQAYELYDITNSQRASLYTGGTGGSWQFSTEGTERLRITSDGKLGLGTSAPEQKFEIAESGTFSRSLVFETSSGSDCYITAKATGASTSLNTNLNLRADGSVSHGTVIFSRGLNRTYIESMRIDSAGNVGIGTTSPGALLDVSASAPELRISSSNAAQTSGSSVGKLSFYTPDSTTPGGAGVAAFIETTSSTSNGSDYQLLISKREGSGGGSCFVNLGTSSSGAISFGTNTSGAGTERVRIDSSGRLLVGTSSSSADTLFRVQGKQSSSASNGVVQIARGQTNPGGDNGLGYVDFTDAAGSIGASIRAETELNWGASDYPTRLVFSTTADGASSPTGRQLIKSYGRSFFYSSDGGVTSMVSAVAGTVYATFEGRHSATGVDGGSGTASFRAFSNGDVVNTNNSYGSISDNKLKENIVDANSQWDDLKALQVRNYNFKEETGQQTHTQIGLIAQEVELVSPGLVSESPDLDEEGNDLGTVTKSVNYSVLYMKAVKALQEAMERIETLEAEVTALKAQ